MESNLEEYVMSFRSEQPLNNPSESFVTSSGSLIFARCMQFENAPPPICVTVSGMFTERRLAQDRNAQSPIDVTPCGMSIDVNSWQKPKA